MERLTVTVATEDSLSVRRFSVREALSTPFVVDLVVKTPNDDPDLDGMIGKEATFRIRSGVAHLAAGTRTWTGVVEEAEHVEAESGGLSMLHLRIVPRLRLLAQRTNARIFQHRSLPEVVRALLAEWRIAPRLELSGAHPPRDYVTQYNETDLDFVHRLLEWAGVTYSFADGDDGETVLVLSDAPQAREGRAGPPIRWVDQPNQESEQEHVTRVRIAHRVRPGKVTLRDHDFERRPDADLLGTATRAAGPEAFYEVYRYEPGGFLIDGAVHDDAEGQARAERELAAARRLRERVAFATNCPDLAPGMVFTVAQHPHPDLEGQRLLVTSFALEGSHDGEWAFSGEAAFARDPLVPALSTPRPKIRGVQSAIVVGPPGEEIHTDAWGRVRVQFPWDREGRFDDQSSCWLRVTQQWAGAGFGAQLVPRVGQEVLVAFLGGDPDRPIVVGRVFNATTQVPYALPAGATQSGWKSASSPATGGFNELRFEDAIGQELVYLQAERDLRRLVKESDTQRAGGDRTAVVGGSRTETIGKAETTMVGLRHVVQMMAPADLGILAQAAPTLVPGTTTLDMTPFTLVLTTGRATVALTPGSIALEAQGDITVEAKGGDLVLHGKKTLVNTESPPAAPVPLPIAGAGGSGAQ